MKNTIHVILAAILGFGAVSLGHAETVVGGPKGGRLFETAPHKAEFFVTADGKAEIIFYTQALEPAARGTQVVAITAEAPSGRVVVELEPTAHGFVSLRPLPEGAPYRVVVQVRPAAGEKPQNFRVDLDLTHCGGCSRIEYACTCDH